MFLLIRRSGLVDDSVILNAVETRALKKESILRKPRNRKTIFSFTIDNFSKQTSKVYSDPVRWRKEQWKMLVFPRGNASEGDVSFYLCAAREIPRNKVIHIDFILTVINQLDPTKSKSRELSHKFTRYENDWGYISFMKFDRLMASSEGFCVNDRVIVQVEFRDHPDDLRLLTD